MSTSEDKNSSLAETIKTSQYQGKTLQPINKQK
jgi:hypothetical protein